MAAWCPCGCGKKLSLIERGGGRQVRALDDRIEFLDSYARALEGNPSTDAEGLQRLEAFIADGRAFRNEMLAVIHGELDARDVDRRAMNAWGMQAASMKGNVIAALTQYHATHA